jgi:hypothetical protein
MNISWRLMDKKFSFLALNSLASFSFPFHDNILGMESLLNPIVIFYALHISAQYISRDTLVTSIHFFTAKKLSQLQRQSKGTSRQSSLLSAHGPSCGIHSSANSPV